MNWFKKLFHIHKWKRIQNASYSDVTSMMLGIMTRPAIRECSKCGKRQVMEKHCLGLNPPEYVEDWRDL